MIVPPSSIDQVLLGGDYFSSSEKTGKILNIHRQLEFVHNVQKFDLVCGKF